MRMMPLFLQSVSHSSSMGYGLRTDISSNRRYYPCIPTGILNVRNINLFLSIYSYALTGNVNAESRAFLGKCAGVWKNSASRNFSVR